MTLAVDAYRNVTSLRDESGMLNLALSIDEGEFVSPVLNMVVKGALEEEVQNAMCNIRQYHLKDPYGDLYMRNTISEYFGISRRSFEVFCAPGVDALLHGFSIYASRCSYIIGNIYPDYPHWIGVLGKKCLSRYSFSLRMNHSGAIRISRSKVVYLERPSIQCEDVTDLNYVRKICDVAAAVGSTVLVDESFGNYCELKDSAAKLVGHVDNIAVLRGYSKAYSLGGLRFGYCIASTNIAPLVRRVLPPLGVSSFSLHLGRRLLDSGDIFLRLRQRIREVKVSFAQILKDTPASFLNCDECTPHISWIRNSSSVQEWFRSIGILGKNSVVWSEKEQDYLEAFRLTVPLNTNRYNIVKRRIKSVLNKLK